MMSPNRTSIADSEICSERTAVLTLGLLSLLVAVPPVLAAAGGTLSGNVTDQFGAPVGGALVEATAVEAIEVEEGAVRAAATDEEGAFRIDEIPFGTYRVIVRGTGIQMPEPVSVTVGPGASLELEIRVGRLRASGDDGYAEVLLHYGTDRAVVSGVSPRTKPARYFGPDRGSGRLELGTCRVSIPTDHRMGELESPSILKLQFQPDPEKHVVLLEVSPQGLDEFRASLTRSLNRSVSKAAFVFIHGYRTTFEEASRRTAQLHYDLGFDGAPILFSWPSRGETHAYSADEASVEWAWPHLRDFVRLLVADKGIETLHLVAHSMGNRALTWALRDLRSNSGAGLEKVHQVALVAPDIDAGVFKSQLAPAIEGSARRITLYASDNDHALNLSQIVHRFARVGDMKDGLTVVRGVDTIDVTDVDSSLVGHSYVNDNDSVLSDLYYVFRGVLPGQRFRLVPLRREGLPYWKLVP